MSTTMNTPAPLARPKRTPVPSLPKCAVTGDEQKLFELASANMLEQAPFFARLLYLKLVTVPTRAIERAATDGFHLYWNPDFFKTLTVRERVFVIAHEVWHAMVFHCDRLRTYQEQQAPAWLGGDQFEPTYWNYAGDFIINASLIEAKIGDYNKAWLYDQRITGTEMTEEVYRKIAPPNPPQQPQQGQGGQGQSQPCNGQPGPGQGKPQPGQGYGKGRGDPMGGRKTGPGFADGGGQFDEHLPSPMGEDGSPMTPDEDDWKEAVAAAAQVAKSMGKMPGSLQRFVDQMLKPQVPWQEKLRFTAMRVIGRGGSDWARPNRRRLVFGQYFPGPTGFGCEWVVLVADTSGSIGAAEFARYLGEWQAILDDVKPRRVSIMHVDARVARVDEVEEGEDLFATVGRKGLAGGGGTDFRPAFDWVEEQGRRPDCLIYFTDTYGAYPDEAPPYPVLWCITVPEGSAKEPPFGEAIYVTLEDK